MRQASKYPWFATADQQIRQDVTELVNSGNWLAETVMSSKGLIESAGSVLERGIELLKDSEDAVAQQWVADARELVGEPCER